MTDNKLPKLRVSEAKASEKIRRRIDKGKELLETEISTAEEFKDFERVTEKWSNYNTTLFHVLFDKSPLPNTHGERANRSFFYRVNMITHWARDHKENIGNWIHDLDSIYEQLELYEELPNNTQQAVNNSPINNENKTIFIGHGRSPIWREAKDFITETLGLEYEEFDRISAAGKSINNRLEEMLGKSCMAFLIMTGEDEHLDGSEHARQNVIHEIGKCQDRFGSERAIILLEEGCQEFSNIDGIVYIDFAKGNIKEAFGDIVKVLIRESIIRIELCN